MGIRIQLTSFLNANLGVILLIICIMTNHWAGRESEEFHIHEGIWTSCTHHKHDSERSIWCKPVKNAFGHKANEYLGILIFLALATLLHAISIIVAIYLFCKQRPKLEKGLAALQFFILLFTVIGLAIYATVYDNNYYALKWSYALGWGATLCMFAALVFTIINIDRKRPN